jgi:hypothetical protein
MVALAVEGAHPLNGEVTEVAEETVSQEERRKRKTNGIFGL